MRKNHTFTVKQGTWQVPGKIGQPCWYANEHHGTPERNGSNGGGAAFDTKEEAEQWLYKQQKLCGIPDSEIEWIGLEPQNAVEQMELAFFVKGAE